MFGFLNKKHSNTYERNVIDDCLNYALFEAEVELILEDKEINNDKKIEGIKISLRECKRRLFGK